MKQTIAILLLLAVLALSFTNIARVISGQITDEKGLPIPGATVIIKGTKTAVLADANGQYQITINNNDGFLLISSVGFNTKEIKIGDNNTIDISLEAVTESLNDVIITSRQQVADKVHPPIANIPPVNVYNALQGKVSGVQISQGNIRLRGLSSYSRKSKSQTSLNQFNYQQGFNGYFSGNFNTEGYEQIIENPYQKVSDNPLSTFSIDVDAASYSNVRRMINNGQLPPPGAVRIEEMVNYFTYQYPQPQGNDPFSVNTEMAACPWNNKHKLALIGLQGKTITYQTLPATNLVFLVDVSGSMIEPNKLPLVQASLALLVDQLRPQDRVSLVAYAGNAGLVLPSTSGENKIKIKEAINQLEGGGSTAGGEGIQLAYKIALQNFVTGGNNRVILCTDGDFNVGLSSDDELENLIEKERASGVYLTVLGYGTGNYQDAKMQKLADKGNGNHAYIDGINEAKKVLVNEFGGTLFTIAKDVKLQVEFNPAKVRGYRLIGYENRMLAKEDFNNDKKDAGELGSGHTVTALYEIIPAGTPDEALDSMDAMRYQKPARQKPVKDYAGECMNIKLRYKQPDGNTSMLIEHPLMDGPVTINNTSNNFRFAAAVAEFGLLLRDSKYKGVADFEQVQSLAENSQGKDKEGYRKEFVTLVENAALLKDGANAKKVNMVPIAAVR